ncbi:minor capsid protein [Dyadobacter sp. CY356]|uniref:minor capsid protein n=1 Tax=Dyadobacter sp. CY356 TaxID=2906442 RepID=UPI001F303881|nr:minor capsid protein [Dyadobacter sp. CY356]MCF0055522.1 phage head morphogenesis protein [Dyadobacter sp. CY356]
MTPNEEIQNASIRHMVWLERFKAGTVKQIIALLNQTDKDLREKLAGRLSSISERGYKLSPETRKRIETMLAELQAIRTGMYDTAQTKTTDILKDFAVHEADFQGRLIDEAIKATAVKVTLESPSLSQIRAVATSRPFEGRLLKEWFAGIEANDRKRLSDAIKIGITEGETSDQIIRRVMGTRSAQYRDGILEVSRREAAAVVNTAVATTANQASEDLYASNPDIVKGVQWVSTLDSRTSAPCRANDGKIFPIGEGPRPPIHFNCRSKIVPFLGETSIKGTRASVFGPVPSDLTYSGWLKKQTVDIQNEVLGVKAGKLFRNGLTIEKFVDKQGRSYTLDELKQRDADIWQKTFGR